MNCTVNAMQFDILLFQEPSYVKIRYCMEYPMPEITLFLVSAIRGAIAGSHCQACL